MSTPHARTFFDIHMHAMDLSHPNLLAFINRIDGLGLKLVLGGLAEPFLRKQEQKTLNLLTVMENPIEDYFILMEYFLKSKQPVVDPKGSFKIGDHEFDTLLLTPLIMDFDFKNIKTNTFYNMALGKPVVGQTADVLNAIKKYRTCEFALRINGSGNSQEGISIPRTSRPLFEIYPFMGINPRKYEITRFQDLLMRCFSGYTGHRKDLYANMGNFDGRVENIACNVFAGIKLYPPLGFDPWPDGDAGEMAKVRMLYQWCQDKSIPITVHCSDGGFKIDDNASAYTNPNKWRSVLSEYKNLKLNLAHFGKQGDKLGFIPRHDWRNTIIELILTHENVYTDLSCLAFDEKFYKDFNKLLEGQGQKDRNKLLMHILFGLDFMINLLWANSYNEYLSNFIHTLWLEQKDKLFLCNLNPARFL
ncbi:MAG: amidohydrolase family protein, partial [Methylococcaceae bacterium]|nr:amidohydrolase family protein [Methylococcaceae bacterium]